MDMQAFLSHDPNNFETDTLLAYLNPDELEAYEERSAIMEYDGGLSRDEAEFRALRIILSGKMKQAI